MAATLRFSIVTPSYKQPDWLRLCARSVADQTGEGITVEHIVQDSLSGPEIAESLNGIPSVRLESEKDNGMYDAINRGWSKASGDIVAWLNCDEEYLPGALQHVADYFNGHPAGCKSCNPFGADFIVCGGGVMATIRPNHWVMTSSQQPARTSGCVLRWRNRPSIGKTA